MASDSEMSIQHFRDTLVDQTKALTELCDKWSEVLDGQTLSSEIESHEELLGLIRTTIGQARLLMSQRFKQFSQLIDDCQNQTGQHPTRLTDLSGFWDMISYQVEDVRVKFKRLDTLYDTREQ